MTGHFARFLYLFLFSLFIFFLLFFVRFLHLSMSAGVQIAVDEAAFYGYMIFDVIGIGCSIFGVSAIGSFVDPTGPKHVFPFSFGFLEGSKGSNGRLRFYLGF